MVAWALVASGYRDAEGALTGAVCLPIAIGIAIVVAGSGCGTSFQAFAGWVALALVGQAVTLQTIDAGRRLHFQHYQPLTGLWRTRPSLLAWIAIQTLIVGVALGQRTRAANGLRPAGVRPWQIAIAAILSLSTAATVSVSVPRYLAELAFAISLQLLGVATIVAVASAFPGGALDAVRRGVDRLAGTAGIETRVAALVTIVAAVLNICSYQRHPHVEDEVADLLQARYMAKGMLTMPAPPVPEAFDVEQMYFEQDRWWAPIPPGWPAALAVGVVAGVPWLINPLLGGAAVLLAFAILRRVYDRRIAAIGVCLLAVSPWYVFLSMSFMTHMLTLTLALLAAVFVAWARETGRARWALAAGVSLGLMVLARPLDAVIAAAVLGLWSIGFGGTRLKPSAVAALVAGTAAVGSLTFPYNQHLTGDPLVFPINAYFEKYWGHNSNAYGFGADRGANWPIDPNPGHSPLDALINANLNTFSLNTDLFGWTTGSLIFIAMFLCSRATSHSDRLMMAVMAVVFAAHFFYYFSGGPDFGARYWFLMAVPLIALTVRGIEWLAQAAGPRVFVAVLVLSAMAVVDYFPWRAIDKYYRYLDMRPDIRELASTHAFDGGLVLIRGRRGPDYGSAAVENPVDLTSPAPIYAWDRSAEVRAALLRAFPNRPVWIVEGPTITKAGYRVVQGPLPAAAVTAQTWHPPSD